MTPTFQVEWISRLLGRESGVSAVYLPALNWPAWVAVSGMAREGASVTVFRGAGETGQSVRIARSDSQVAVKEFAELNGNFAAGCDLVVIDDPATHRDLLRDALVTGVRPSVIALNDSAEDATARRAKYELLTGAKYYYAGLFGEYSLWSAAKRPAAIVETTLAVLPREIGALPLRGKGVAHLDNGTAPKGEVLHLPVRSALRISGWAMIAEDAPLAEQVFACVRHEESGLEEFVRLSREPRPDVSTHFGNERLLMAGFRADISALCRRIGVHEVTFVQSNGLGRYESEPLLRFALRLQDYEVAARTGLANRYLYGSGIEIGALQKPLRLSDGCQVRYIDRMTLSHLLEHYPEMAKLPLQAPDIVDDGQHLAHIAEDSQDFVIANHFLEHCPDPVRSLQTILRVLRQSGILYLAVPDKRNTFDLCRPVTSYAALKSAYLSGQRSGVSELFYEWAHLVSGLPPDEAKVRADELIAEDYSIHYNVWSTTDLLSFLLMARQDFQMPFELIAAVSSENETIVLLERTGGRLPI